MGKAPARAVTDDELLSDEGDSLDQLDDQAGEEEDQHQDGIIGGEKEEAADNDLEVVILDEDEGKDKPKKEAAEEDKEAADAVVDDEDSGEEVDTSDEPRGELTDWEKKNYSKAMQSRVLRERSIRVREVAQAKQEASQAARDAQKARSDALEARKLSTALLGEVLERDIAQKSAEVLKLKEEGESEKELKALGELDDLRAKKRDVDAAKARLDAVKPEEVKETPTESADTTSWKGRNRWFANPQFANKARYTRVLDAGLAEDFKAGHFAHAPGTSKYFAELDKRIHDEMPTLRQQIRKVYGTPKPSTPSAPVSRGAPVRSAGNKVVLTRADLQNMRDFGLDPANKADLKQFAETKRQLQMEERGRS